MKFRKPAIGVYRKCSADVAPMVDVIRAEVADRKSSFVANCSSETRFRDQDFSNAPSIPSLSKRSIDRRSLSVTCG